MTKLQRWRNDSLLPRVRVGEEEGNECDQKGEQEEDLCGEATILYLDCDGGYRKLHMW